MGALRICCAILLLIALLISTSAHGSATAEEPVGADVGATAGAQNEAEPIVLSDDSCHSAPLASTASDSAPPEPAQQAETPPGEASCGVLDTDTGADNADDDDTGGWSTDWMGCEWCVDALPSKARQIERVRAEDMTLERFQQEFEWKKPVIIVGGGMNRDIRSKFSKAKLIEKYGDMEVPVGSAATTYLGITQERLATMKLRDYIEIEMEKRPVFGDHAGEEEHQATYLFEWGANLAPAGADDMLADWKVHPFFKFGTHEHDRVVALGSTQTGLPFHIHGSAWNEVLYGTKRWWMYPPEHSPTGGYFEWKEHVVWLRDNYNKIEKFEDMPWEGIQRPGDLAYIPEGWYHATLNCGQTVAVASPNQDKEGYRKGSATESFFYGLAETDPKRATKYFDDALKHLPNHELLLFNAGKTLGQSGNYARAKQLLEKSIAINPKRPDAYFSLALSELQSSPGKLKSLRKAVGYLNKVHDLKPPRDYAAEMLFAAAQMQAQIYGTVGDRDNQREKELLAKQYEAEAERNRKKKEQSKASKEGK